MTHRYKFNFPPNARAGVWDYELKHAAGEIVEACTAFSTAERIDEVLDTLECLENSLRDLAAGNMDMLNEAYERHYQKNLARGDYR